ncbi:DAK2 domain-containing protein [Mesorhizobium loti]|nr:DAK2 domain-containing protein [Mesorhizobium loti]QKC92516.1 DAK2 domain-containing protein [Mesorhizobium sp. NZP2234]
MRSYSYAPPGKHYARAFEISFAVWIASGARPFAAAGGADATASMSPRLGRASYLGERAVGAPDGSAAAVAIWMRAIAQAIAKQG